jgi:glycosyltransferase involved in cell wall biosynthesis
VLAIAVANEIPVDLIRLHGIDSVGETLSQLVGAVHEADEAMLATYVNFPTTEFLEVDGQDVVCFNVFLEEAAAFRRYVRHLQVVSRDRPLILTEVGLSAGIHGDRAQARLLDEQLRIIEDTGIAGATVYAWTDEWAVNDEPVEGWNFGITSTDRTPKAALQSVTRWTHRRIEDLRKEWPPMSVIVCAYNEERTLGECLSSLEACTYPDLEVIVCDDGSTDRTLAIAHDFPFKVLDLPHGGLSRARNAGLDAATGDIVAYLDADAACHPEWPFHLALSMEDPSVVATGGPNLPVRDAGLVERAVALSPGGPTEVLVTDDRAEHVPGCNMAFRRRDLLAVGGFNVAYTAAGDDVDVCWKLLDAGGEIGFSPAAQIRHHRRATVKGYLKQQRGYGKAERMLAGPHGHRFNGLGQASWRGFIYGGSRILPSLLRPVVYHGRQGAAPFQPVSRHRSSAAADWAGALLPITALAAMAGAPLALGWRWWLLLPALIALLVVGYAAAVAAALPIGHNEPKPATIRALVGVLHVLQPFARLWGRIRARALPGGERDPEWTGSRSHWLTQLKTQLERDDSKVRIGGVSDTWDLQVSVGPFVAVRIATAVVWNWEPRWRRWYVPRPTLLLALVVALGLVVVDPRIFLGALGLACGWVAADSMRLRTRTSYALDFTTRAAEPPAGQAATPDPASPIEAQQRREPAAQYE